MRRAAGAGTVGRSGKVNAGIQMGGTVVTGGYLQIICRPEHSGNAVRHQVIPRLKGNGGAVALCDVACRITDNGKKWDLRPRCETGREGLERGKRIISRLARRPGGAGDACCASEASRAGNPLDALRPGGAGGAGRACCASGASRAGNPLDTLRPGGAGGAGRACCANEAGRAGNPLDALRPGGAGGAGGAGRACCANEASRAGNPLDALRPGGAGGAGDACCASRAGRTNRPCYRIRAGPKVPAIPRVWR